MMVCGIQARMSSTRLPGKVLLDLNGKTVLQRVIERVQKSRHINKIIVCTSVNSENNAIVELCNNLAVGVMRGSETDLLDRYNTVCNMSDANHVVRITADCPLIDPEIIDAVIEKHLAENNDLTSNALMGLETFPDGLDCEIIKRNTLYQAWKEAKLPREREHVTTWIKSNIIKFKIGHFKSEINYNKYRWTLDEYSDYLFIKSIYDRLDENCKMKDVIELLEIYPELCKINEHIVRNEGYYKSLENDKQKEI